MKNEKTEKKTKVEMKADEMKAVSGGALGTVAVQVVKPVVNPIWAGDLRHW